MHKKVVVQILSYNGLEFLEECVSSYLQNNYENFQIVVVDNGSNDGTVKWLEKNFPTVKVIRTEKNLGYSGGMNLGLEYAFNDLNADYVLITNNDVKADKALISSLVECAEPNPDAGFINGKVYYYDLPNTLQYIGKSYDEKYWRGNLIGHNEIDYGQYDKDMELAWTDDVYWLVSRKLFYTVGGYDTEFKFQAEDFDYQARAKRCGFKIIYCHKAKLWHKVSATIGKNSHMKSFYDARNPLIVHFKHRKFSQVLPYFFFQIKNQIISTFVYIKRKMFKNLFFMWFGFFSAILWLLKHKIKNIFYGNK